MASFTAIEVILDWLYSRYTGGRATFFTHDFEEQIVNYGKVIHAVLHTPSYYGRQWRKLREAGNPLPNGLYIEEVPIPNRLEKQWKISLQATITVSSSLVRQEVLTVTS